jgi:hypothetical protein
LQNVFAEKDLHSKSEKYSIEELKGVENLDLEGHTNVTSVNGRDYHFFNDNVFECDLFKSFVKEDDFEFLNNNSILRAYYLMIYPATSWLDDESLHILEIL